MSCRDVNTQAIFVLKGKPLNVWDLKRDIVYKNDEMYNLMRSLDIEDNLEGLRYEKVILATDADVDGLHIRNLLITYFFRFFDQLVHDGASVCAGDAAVPRAQQGADDLLLLRGRARRRGNEARRQEPRDHAVQGPGRNQPDGVQAVHRQGNAPEPGGIRAQNAGRAGIFDFYMGKNTPERKDYIMDNLVVPVEE